MTGPGTAITTRPNWSAAAAVLRRLREELRRRDRDLGLTPGFGRFLEMVGAAPQGSDADNN